MQKKSKHEITIRSAAAEYLTFVSTVGDQPGSVELRYEDENIWLTQRLMAELYGVSVPAISKHLRNIFDSEELIENVVVSKMEITTEHGAIEGKTQLHKAMFYNLDAIISVGNRVNSVKKRFLSNINPMTDTMTPEQR